MNSNQKLTCAIAAILGGSAPGFVHAAAATDTEASDAIQEVVVTAQRRSENIQNVPIAIQAFTTETLNQLNVQTFADLIKYLPNVTAPTNGPSQGSIYMRGLSIGGYAGTQSTGSIGGFPNVATYLDDQSGQLPGRNLDIYAADLERIEVLEGPQGVTFGAGAQAGVVRYITNKPKLDVTEGYANASYSTTAHGDYNSSAEAMINLPLIPDTLAVRAVIYNDSQGGYIDNVAGTFTRKNSDFGIHYAGYATKCKIGAPTAAGLCTPVIDPITMKNLNGGTAFAVPPGSPSINNSSTVANNINPVTYQGIRAEVLYKINDDWNALITQSYQNMDAQGVFYQMPHSSDGVPLAPLEVTLFNNSFNKDRFENTAWTINGKIWELNAIYTGSYLVRNVSQLQDYTNYARGFYADYYQCHSANSAGTLSATCYSPSTTWTEQERNTHQSQEARLSTPDDWRLRGLVGAFYEDQRLFDQTDWQYKTLPPCTATVTLGCMTNIGPAPNSTAENSAVRNDNTGFFEDIQRGYKQYAFFGSADFDIFPKVLTVTAGTRYYHFYNYETGSAVGSFGCYQHAAYPCETDAFNIDAQNLNSTYQGFKSRANVTWHLTNDIMAYYTWSQGFRPGGFNRESSCHIPDANGINQFCIPLHVASDALTNNEAGWKTQWLQNRIQWNGAVYQENWNNVQFGFFDPGQLGNLAFGDNGPNYRIRGVETSIVARVVQGLTAQGSASWNSSTQTNSPYLPANNPALLLGPPSSVAAYGKNITAIQNPYGQPGSPSANSPPLQFNVRLRYEWTFNTYNAFAQVGANHTAHSYTQSANFSSLPASGAVSTTLLRFQNPAYSQYDMSLGVAKDKWTVEAFGQNITDVIASVFTSTAQFVPAEVVTRPRVLGVKFSYKF